MRDAYGASNCVVYVTGEGSVFSNGSAGAQYFQGTGMVIRVQDGGLLHINGYPWVQHNGAQIIVEGTGSVCRTGNMYLADRGRAGEESLVVSNGGYCRNGGLNLCNYGYAGQVLVTGEGSIFTNTGTMNLGFTGYNDNKYGLLRVEDGARTYATTAYIPHWQAERTNSVADVRVNGDGSLFRTTGSMLLGNASALGEDMNVRGTLEVGAGGRAEARGNLSVYSNSVLRFVADAAGFGQIQVDGTLTIGDGAKMEIDGSAYSAANGVEVVLVSYASGSKTGAFSEDDITVTGLGDYRIDQETGKQITLRIVQGAVFMIK